MKILLFLFCSFFLVSCSDKSVRHIFPSEDKTIEEIMNSSMDNKQKAAAIKEHMTQIILDTKPEYQRERDVRLAGIISKPISPLKTPEKILRVLIMPYSDDSKSLNTWRYVFITVDEGQWIIGDYLTNTTPTGTTFTPLKK